MASVPGLALLGAGLFVRAEYVKHLAALQERLELKYVWSRSQGPAEEVAGLVQGYCRAVAVHGEEGLQKVLGDPAVHAVAVVLPALAQPDLVLRALRAGKHVLQEKPVAGQVEDALKLLEVYRSLSSGDQRVPIWAVAENYRFEPGLIQAGQLVKRIGKMMVAEVIMEAPMTNASPYFSSPWRRDAKFAGAFLVDGGVHFIAGMRMIVGCEVTSVSASSAHNNELLPPPDTLTALLKFQNGAAGVLVMTYAATIRKGFWRVIGSEGTVEADRGVQDGKHGYKATLYRSGVASEEHFFPFQGVQDELKTFAEDVAKAVSQGEGSRVSADSRGSAVEAILDLATVQAMLESAAKNSAQVEVSHSF